MNAQKTSLAPGLGLRLRAERKRLGLNQGQLAAVAGTTRLTQSQYEAETQVPRLTYFAAIGGAGVDLYYVLFSRTNAEIALTAEQQIEVERRAFDIVENYVQTKYQGKLSAEGRYVLFQVIRAQMSKSASIGLPLDADIGDMIAVRGNRA
jgi:transcriptional regulator with XRE-family HTH domain